MDEDVFEVICMVDVSVVIDFEGCFLLLNIVVVVENLMEVIMLLMCIGCRIIFVIFKRFIVLEWVLVNL